MIKEVGWIRAASEQKIHKNGVATVLAALGEEAFSALGRGRSMPLEQAIEYALAETRD